MKKIVRLTESDLTRIVRRVLKESKEDSIKKVSKYIKQPYIKSLMDMGIEVKYWGDILSQLLNEKVGIRQGLQGGLFVYDSNGKDIYIEKPESIQAVQDLPSLPIFTGRTIVDEICEIMNPSYPYGMTKDEEEERVMDWGEIIVWGEGDIGDTDNNILISFLCVDEEEYEGNEDFFVGDLNIVERFLDMAHTINPNLSRSNIISIIKECFLDVYQKEVSREIVINSVRVV